MRRGDRSLKKSAKKFSKEKVSVKATYFGELGITLGGSQVVNVPGRQGFVFARLNGNTSELIQALNTAVPSAYGLNVQIQREGQNYKIIGKDVQVYSNQGTQIPGGMTTLPKHGVQHSFAPELGMGADVAWIFSRQFMPLLVYPSGSSNLLSMSPAFYEWNGAWKYAQVTGTINLTQYVPTGTGNARMALVFINPATNGIEVLGGTVFSSSITNPSSLAGLIPDVDRNNSIPLAAIRLVTGTNSIDWTQIYDMRDFYTVSKHWAGMGFQNAGVPLGTGTSLNFGTNLSATLLNGIVTVNATAGGGGGGLGFVAQDEGVFLVTGTTLNFVGAGVQVSASGSIVRVQVDSGSSSITGSVVIQDDAVIQGSALSLNFTGQGVSASISGSTARINVPSSGLACGGRLSLVSGTAITTNNQAATRIWFVPYMTDVLSVYNGTVWVDSVINSPSVAVPSVATGTFDVFAYDNAGSIGLETLNWADAITRATALTTQNGRLVKSGDATRRYIGTGRTTTSGQCEDSDAKRLLWNYYNRTNRSLKRIDTTSSWTNTAGTPLRPWNNSTANRVEFVIGVAEDPVYLEFLGLHAVTLGGTANVGIGLDSITVNSADISPASNSTITVLTIAIAKYRNIPTVGYHYLQLLEFGNSASDTLFFGLVAAFGGQGGAVGYING